MGPMTTSEARTSGPAPDADTGSRRAPIQLAVHRLDPGLPLPGYAREGDAGLDLHAAESLRLAAGARRAVRTGIAVALPEGCAGFVLPRSGLALRSGLTVLNAPGLIDAGYRGELQVLLVNHGADEVAIERGDRIAQLVVQRVERVDLVEVDALPASVRGAGGFGSTGA